jgi:hypothetical protein
MISTRILIIATTFLTACANKQVELTVNTEPYGAVLLDSASHQTVGGSGRQFHYNWNQDFVDNNCLLVQGYAARWPSGAIGFSDNPLRLCDGENGGYYEITIVRPSSAPKLELDLNNAYQQKQLSILQQPNTMLPNQNVNNSSSRSGSVNYLCVNSCVSRSYNYNFCTSKCSY